MKLKTLLSVGLMTLSAGLLPAGVEAAPTPATPAVPMNASAFTPATGAVQMAPVVVVDRRRRRGYYGNRRGRIVRRVYVDRYGRRRVVTRRVY